MNAMFRFFIGTFCSFLLVNFVVRTMELDVQSIRGTVRFRMLLPGPDPNPGQKRKEGMNKS